MSEHSWSPEVACPSGGSLPSTSRRRKLVQGIGNTPLLRLRTLEPRPEVRVYAKTEWTNPGGSVKDRAALRMIEDGERSGALRPDKIIIDASSGNTGVALGMIGDAFGYRVRVAVPENAVSSRLELLRFYAVDVVITGAAEGVDGAIEEVRREVASAPERYYYTDQYTNPSNWRAHYDGTGQEIYRQTRGSVSHFVAGLGTTGTFVGTGRRLVEYDPRIRLIAVQPDSPLHALEGLKHLESAKHVPGILDRGLIDAEETVSTEEAQQTAFRLGREEGILVGPSAAAAAVAARRVAEGIDSGVVVTVFPDSAGKYLSEPFWKQ